MYAMTGRLTAHPGQRDELANILLQSAEVVAQIGGCCAYIVLEDVKDADSVWVFETWDDKESHDHSLGDERVRALISEARPMIAAMAGGSEFRILGGHGINK